MYSYTHRRTNIVQKKITRKITRKITLWPSPYCGMYLLMQKGLVAGQVAGEDNTECTPPGDPGPRTQPSDVLPFCVVCAGQRAPHPVDPLQRCLQWSMAFTAVPTSDTLLRLFRHPPKNTLADFLTHVPCVRLTECLELSNTATHAIHTWCKYIRRGAVGRL